MDPVARRARLLARALDLRTCELESWTEFRTPEMPDIDKIRQSMAAMGIANVHMIRHQLDPIDLTNTLEQARTWYVGADDFLEGEDSPAAVNQRQTVRTNGLSSSSSTTPAFCTKRFVCAASSTRRITTGVWARC